MTTWRDETRICELRDCYRPFKPIRSTQRYCCPEHRFLAQYRRAERRRLGDRLSMSAQRQQRIALARQCYAISGSLSDLELARLLNVSKSTAWQIRRALGAVPAGPGQWKLEDEQP
jgi:hypothetical protein